VLAVPRAGSQYYQEILRANLHRMSPAELERTRRTLDLAPPI